MNMNIYRNTFNSFYVAITDLTYSETTLLNLPNNLTKIDANYEKLFNLYQNPMEVDKIHKLNILYCQIKKSLS